MAHSHDKDLDRHNVDPVRLLAALTVNLSQDPDRGPKRVSKGCLQVLLWLAWGSIAEA